MHCDDTAVQHLLGRISRVFASMAICDKAMQLEDIYVKETQLHNIIKTGYS